MTVLRSLHEYGQAFQIKVLSSLLRHKEFLQNIHDVLNPDEFDNPAHKWIVENVLKYYYKYHANPKAEFLSIELKKIDNEVLKVSVADQLKEAFKAVNDDRDYVETEFSNFCINQQLKKALLESVDLLGQGKFDDIRYKIDKALKAGQEKNIGHEYDKDIETRYREEQRNAIPTHWDHVNELLMGGLGSGDLGLVFGNPGGGKSWMLVNIGATAVAAGFNVCHYTLELSEDYVGRRYDALFSGYEVQKVAEHRAEVESIISKLPGKLIIKEFAMGKATASTIEAHIQKCKDLGTSPDLVIIDYIDLLKSKSKSFERKDEIDDIYASIKGMARELKLPIWTVSQVNRAGAKDDVIEGDKAAGSYNKMMIADFAMSLSRKRQDKVNGTGRIHVMKNRYGSDGMTYSAKINTSNGHIDISKEAMDEDDLVNESEQTGNLSFNKSFSMEQRQDLAKKFKLMAS
jgi:replicative DNA helicase